jgi:hypothetical protein
VGCGKVVAEEKFQHLQGDEAGIEGGQGKGGRLLTSVVLHLASSVRDSAWADGIHLGFETFRTWWRDPVRKMDLNSVNIEDIPMMSEAIRQLISLGQEEMPNAMGIDRFDCRPEAVPEGGEVEKKAKDVVNSPSAKDPPVDP